MDMISKKKVLRRLQIIKGQVAGVEKMVAEDAYCVDVITQSSAIKAALSIIEDMILEGHLSTHVVMQMKSGQDKKAVAEILKVYRLSKRKS